MLQQIRSGPVRAMRPMVGTTAIDGQIASRDWSILADISLKMGLSAGKLGTVFAVGLAVAPRLRRVRKRPDGT